MTLDSFAVPASSIKRKIQPGRDDQADAEVRLVNTKSRTLTLSHRKCNGGSFRGHASSSGEKQEVHHKDCKGGKGWGGGWGRCVQMGGRAHSAAACDLEPPCVNIVHKFKFQIPGNNILETSGSSRLHIPARRLFLETSGSLRLQMPARSGNFRQFQDPDV